MRQTAVPSGSTCTGLFGQMLHDCAQSIPGSPASKWRLMVGIGAGDYRID
jgi:hypothetical protein